MGAAFAIQVMTGRENNVKKMLDWALGRHPLAQKWIKGVHTFTQGTSRLLESGRLGKRIERATLPGYLFIEMNYSVDDENISAHIPAEIWHLIRSVPGVLRQFTQAGQVIGAGTFVDLVRQFNLDDQVEVAVPLEDRDEDKMKAIQHFNVAETPQQKNEAEAVLVELENEKTLVEQVEEMKTKAVSMAKAIKAFIKRQKEVIHIPNELFQTVDHDVHSYSGRKDRLLPSPSEFVQMLFRKLRTDVRIE